MSSLATEREAKAEGPSRPSPSLSEKIWQIDWTKYFPLSLDDSTSIETTDFETVAAFSSRKFSEIYRIIPETQFQWFETSPAKAKFYELTCDFFAFKAAGRVVGIGLGHPSDWSTYYMRNVTIEPEYQGRKYYQTLMQQIMVALTEKGVARIEFHISPQSTAQMICNSKLGFITTSMTLSDRWGALAHMTKFLSAKHEDAFTSQFSIRTFDPQKTPSSSSN